MTEEEEQEKEEEKEQEASLDLTVALTLLGLVARASLARSPMALAAEDLFEIQNTLHNYMHLLDAGDGQAFAELRGVVSWRGSGARC